MRKAGTELYSIAGTDACCARTGKLRSKDARIARRCNRTLPNTLPTLFEWRFAGKRVEGSEIAEYPDTNRVGVLASLAPDKPEGRAE